MTLAESPFEHAYQIFVPEDIPWNRSFPHFRLIDFLAEHEIHPCRVLDLGCGVGTDALYLAKKGFTVSAIDISKTAVNEAKTKAAAAQASVDFRVASAFELPFQNETFELIIDWRTSHCLAPMQWKKYLHETYRVLAPKGGLLMAAFYLSGFEHEDIKILQRPFEKYPLNEEKVRNLFFKKFRLHSFKVFEMDKKTKHLGGLYFLTKKVEKRSRKINIGPANRFRKAARHP